MLRSATKVLELVKYIEGVAEGDGKVASHLAFQTARYLCEKYGVKKTPQEIALIWEGMGDNKVTEGAARQEAKMTDAELKAFQEKAEADFKKLMDGELSLEDVLKQFSKPSNSSSPWGIDIEEPVLKV